ncbi:unnamed protein product, partial [Amoebophrya sp. A120]
HEVVASHSVDRASVVLHPLDTVHKYIVDAALAAIQSIASATITASDIPRETKTSPLLHELKREALYDGLPYHFEELLTFHVTRMESLFQLLRTDLRSLDGRNYSTRRADVERAAGQQLRASGSPQPTTSEGAIGALEDEAMRKFEFWLHFHRWAFLPGIRAALPRQIANA